MMSYFLKIKQKKAGVAEVFPEKTAAIKKI